MSIRSVRSWVLILVAFCLSSTLTNSQTPAKNPPPRNPLRYVAGLVGPDGCEAKLLTSEPLHSRLKALMGTDYTQFDIRWGMCGYPVNMIDGVVIAINMEGHYGGIEEAMLAVDPRNNAIMVKILHDGKIYTYRETGHPLTLPNGWMGTQDEWSRAVEVGGRVHSAPPQLGPNQ